LARREDHSSGLSRINHPIIASRGTSQRGNHADAEADHQGRGVTTFDTLLQKVECRIAGGNLMFNLRRCSGAIAGALTSLVTTTWGANAQTSIFNGDYLYTICSAPKGTLDDAICSAYIRGVADGQWLGMLSASHFKKPCLPDTNPDPIESRLVVEKYVRDHPASLGLPPFAIIASALDLSYGCVFVP
jgi:hypothetical protein